MASVRKKPNYTVHSNGLILCGGFPKEILPLALKYQPDPDDVFIVTYPKCGTTWCQYILYLLQNEGSPLPEGKNINQFVPHLEEVGPDAIKTLPRPRIIKTHLSFEYLNYNPETKYICIARNPKDCCVSLYHHTRGFVKHYNFADGTFDDFFELFMEGHVDSNDYFDFLLSCYSYKDKPNVLFLLYEDMKSDSRKAIKDIATFLGGPFASAASDPEILDRVDRLSSFTSMKKENPDKWSSERPDDMPGFIRRGVVGDWKNHFSKEQSKRIDEKYFQKTKGTGAEHLWEKHDLSCSI